MDEKQLLTDCINGNHHAQKRLYEKYAGKMYAVCLRYAKDKSTAEDYLQEGFIRVFSKLSKFRSEGSFEGWIRTIMVNTSLEMLRKNNILTKSEDYQQAINLIEPDPSIIEKLQEEQLLECIQSMPPGFRAVFNLYAIEGYNHREIGDMLNISEGTSKSQFARARAWLQQKIQQLHH